MFAELIAQSNIIELVAEELELLGDEDGETLPDQGLYQATLRVVDSKRWTQMMVDLMRDAFDEEGFDLEPRKSFWWDGEKGKAKFNWVLLVWGDLTLAKEAIGDTLSRRHEPKPPPKKSSDPRKRPTGRRSLKSQKVQGMDGGTRIVTTASLPHAKPGRYGGDPHEVVKVNEGKGRRIRAVVSGRGESEFSVQAEKEL